MTKLDNSITQLSPKTTAAIVKAIKRRVRKNYVNVAGIDLESWAQDLDSRRPT